MFAGMLRAGGPWRTWLRRTTQPMRTVGPLQSVLDATPPKLPPDALMEPRRQYVILFTPRSGSSHLAEGLTTAGVGDPREWLHPDYLAERAAMFGARTFEDYFELLRCCCSRDGVFGHKMTMLFYDAFDREVRLDDHFDFGGPTICLYREDIVEQAVSLAFAEHRDVWHDTNGIEPEGLGAVPYDAAKIRGRLIWLSKLERRMAGFIAGRKMPVRYISYEKLVASSLTDVVRAVGAFIDVKPDDGSLTSSHRKLGNSLNREFADRFAAENADMIASIARGRRSFLKRAAQFPLL